MAPSGSQRPLIRCSRSREGLPRSGCSEGKSDADPEHGFIVSGNPLFLGHVPEDHDNACRLILDSKNTAALNDQVKGSAVLGEATDSKCMRPFRHKVSCYLSCFLLKAWWDKGNSLSFGAQLCQPKCP